MTMRARQAARISAIEKLYRGASSHLRLVPDFLIIGTQRGGTTALYHYLKTHPCIHGTTGTDTHFFDKKFQQGVSWYRAHFPTRFEKAYARRFRHQDFVTGEASPAYLFHPQVPGRVARLLPRVKLIVLLRNPIDRAFSQYYHALELGHEKLSFEEALEREQERTAGEYERVLAEAHYSSHAFKHLSYLSRGIYVDQLRAWMRLFPREQFLILKSEDFYADPAATLQEVLAFLQLPRIALPAQKQGYKQYNNNTYNKMDPALRQRLLEYFQPHNARLYQLLGTDFGWDS